MRNTIQLVSCTIVLILMCAQPGFSNNIQITNVSITGQNTTDNYTLIEFDISWENSWRVVGGPSNWDAAWVFIKYRVSPAAPWLHAWLNNTGHTNCGSSTITTGLLNPGAAFDPVTNPGIGVFVYRAAPGSGTFSCQNVQVRWNYGANGLSDNEQVDIKVFAIEHVYVPMGAFSAGSGGSEIAHFYTYPTSTTPYLISSENAIPVGAINGNLYYIGSGDQSGPLPALFPKGFKETYVMKYEISQRSYADFLSTLTRIQQQGRIASTINNTNITGTFVMTNSADPSFRNGVWTHGLVPLSPAPLFFQANLNDNALGNEAGDGADIACNYLNWDDVTAYLDWAGLRPMTELEFEKCGRGTSSPVPNEGCWGSTFVRYANNLPANAGFPNETVIDTLLNFANTIFGPLRCGIMARSGTDRTYSGATYYGMLDGSGNVWESCVSVGNPAGRGYQGTHGDGLLNASGVQNVSTWPTAASGYGLRGGSFSELYSDGFWALSMRSLASYTGYPRQENIGGRGIRTAP